MALVKGALKIMAWTKAKMAVVAGVGVLLAAGTTTMVVKERKPLEVDESWFELRQDTLAKAPDNLRIIRPTHFPGGSSGMTGGDERLVCQNCTLNYGLTTANNFSSSSPTRMELPADFPAERFDYLFTLPPNGNRGWDKLRIVIGDVIRKQFGLVAHLETRQRDVLLLQVKNPGAAGLRNTVQDSISGSGITSSVEGLSSQNMPMYALANTLENHLEIPVLDRTGLTNRFAIDLRWDKLPGETTAETTKRVVLDQLGLELVPGREPIEMLVVERVKN